MPLASWRAPNCDWLTEPKQIRSGVFAARTLLPNQADFAAVRIINVSGADCVIPRDMLLGEAVPGTVLTGDRQTNDSRATDRSARCAGVWPGQPGAPPDARTGDQRTDDSRATDRSASRASVRPDFSGAPLADRIVHCDAEKPRAAQDRNADSCVTGEHTATAEKPCELDGGEPCRQCNHRVTGKHAVGAGQVSMVKARSHGTGRPATHETGQPATPHTVVTCKRHRRFAEARK